VLPEMDVAPNVTVGVDVLAAEAAPANVTTS
jgi:hypothetical protein